MPQLSARSCQSQELNHENVGPRGSCIDIHVLNRSSSTDNLCYTPQKAWSFTPKASASGARLGNEAFRTETIDGRPVSCGSSALRPRAPAPEGCGGDAGGIPGRDAGGGVQHSRGAEDEDQDHQDLQSRSLWGYDPSTPPVMSKSPMDLCSSCCA